MLHELSQLRRDDHRAVRTAIEREIWGRKVASEDEQADQRFDQETRERHCAPYFARLELKSLAKLFGSGDAAHNLAAFILEMQNDLPVGRLGRRGRESDAAPSQSGLVKPDQTGSNQTRVNPILSNQNQSPPRRPSSGSSGHPGLVSAAFARCGFLATAKDSPQAASGDLGSAGDRSPAAG